MCRKCACRSNFGHPVGIQGRFDCDHSTRASLLWSITLNSKSFDRSFLHLFAWFGGFKRIWNSQEKLEGLMYVPRGQSCKFCQLNCYNICCDYNGLHRSSSIAQVLNRRRHNQNLFQQLNESSRMGWPLKTRSSQQTFSRVYTLLAKTLFCTVGFRSFDVMPAERRCQFWCVSDSIRASQM